MDYFLLYVRKNYGYNENHSRILPVSSQPFHNTAKKGHRFMKTAAIIAEYNPFHNGHFYQIQKLHDQIDADFVIALMSGDFVQRGEPAVYDKYTRTYMALNSGIDLVLELPVCFATGSAEDFAACGVALLDQLGVVDVLCFGSEWGELSPLCQVAEVLLDEPEVYSDMLRTLLKQGISFPGARSQALKQYFALKKDSSSSFDWASLLASPNNILGIEYLKALKTRNSSIKPWTIRRHGQNYNDQTPVNDRTTFASASAIRRAIQEENYSMVWKQTPQTTPITAADASPAAANFTSASTAPTPANFASSATTPPPANFTSTSTTPTTVTINPASLSPTPVFPNDLTQLLNYRLLDLFQSNSDRENPFSLYADMSPELASRLKANVLNFGTFSQRIHQLKTRGYTYTRISRALLHVLLGITDLQIACCKQLDFAPYARVLGFRRSAGLLLRQMKCSSSIPLITKTADARNILDENGLTMLNTDIHASHLYQSVVFSKNGILTPNEYTKSVIIC